ncbi:hypothetical protein KA078_02000 [Candidatus Woesebacteria bacterium]|nr:hypothetical protein [Candidatus Woesebacteria bacterium]
MQEKTDRGIAYLEGAINAFPENNFFYQITLLELLLRITQATHALEVAERPENPPQLPIDPHGFPALPHMLGNVQFAIERYKAEQTFRKRKAEALLDTMMNADPSVITAAGQSLQAGQLAEQRLIAIIAGLKPNEHDYIKTLTPNKGILRKSPITVDPAMPAVLQTVNTPNPFNDLSEFAMSPGYSYRYVSSPSARAMIKYLPPLEREYVEDSNLTIKMMHGALLVLQGKSVTSSTNTGRFLHLFNAKAGLRSFGHPHTTGPNRLYNYYDLDAPSTSGDYMNFPLFELVRTLPPELIERLAQVDLRDITSEEQLKFYAALGAISKLCAAIEVKFNQYVAQTLSDQSMTIFLTEKVATTLESTLASLDNARLKNELKVGYAALMTRMRTEKGLNQGSSNQLMNIQRTSKAKEVQSVGGWLKKTFLGS